MTFKCFDYVNQIMVYNKDKIVDVCFQVLDNNDRDFATYIDSVNYIVDTYNESEAENVGEWDYMEVTFYDINYVNGVAFEIVYGYDKETDKVFFIEKRYL